MHFSTKSLSLLCLALCIAPAFAKPLTEKQTEAAAARIDSLLAADLKAAKLTTNPIIDDGTFLRRAYLGIIGRIPTEEESRSFLDDASPRKRTKLIDSLVVSPGYDSHLFNWTADLLRVQTKQEQFGLGWHVWLRKSLTEDKSWDVLVREMLASTGHAAKNPAVGYYLRDRNMQLDNFSNTMQVFLGRQIGCAQCHDHPFDDWSQHEYYQMAAFTGGTTYRSMDARITAKRVTTETVKTKPEAVQKAEKKKKNKRPDKGINRMAKLLQPLFRDFNKNEIYDDSHKELLLPEDYQYRDAEPKSAVLPETLFGKKLSNVSPEQRREAFAEWVTSADNPYFTKVIANRLWARTFGHGLLHPVDDWNEDSKPAHPQVLAFLEQTMKEVNYDLRQFTRVLYHTDLFQRASDATEPELGVPHLVRGPTLQRMSAEQIYDSMIVLNRGEIDDGPRDTNSYQWDAYTAAVEKMLTADSHDLIVLAEAASQAETSYRKAQSEGRALQRAIADAEPGTEKKEVFAALQANRKEQQIYRKQRDPLGMVMSGSGSMEMMMEGGGGKRDKRESKGQSQARASEHPAPFNPATLVREFGGSDRTTPSSSDTIPTVPQALALLNDRSTDIIGGGKKSSLVRKLMSADSPAERLETIFIRLYSRLPTTDEIERYTPLAKDRESLRDLTRAMLTSNRFIFVQ